MAAVFARGTSDSLTSLVKQIDATKGINSFVIMMSDDEDASDKIKAYAEKAGVKKTIFAIDNVAGPGGYKIAKDAEITVLLYNKGKVEANHAFRKSEFNAAAVESVVKDLPKITPAPKE